MYARGHISIRCKVSSFVSTPACPPVFPEWPQLLITQSTTALVIRNRSVLTTMYSRRCASASSSAIPLRWESSVPGHCSLLISVALGSSEPIACVNSNSAPKSNSFFYTTLFRRVRLILRLRCLAQQRRYMPESEPSVHFVWLCRRFKFTSWLHPIGAYRFRKSREIRRQCCSKVVRRVATPTRFSCVA